MHPSRNMSGSTVVPWLYRDLPTGVIGHTWPNCLWLSSPSIRTRPNLSHFKLLHVNRGVDCDNIFGQVCVQFVDIDVGANFAVLSANLLGLARVRHVVVERKVFLQRSQCPITYSMASG